MTIKIDLGTEAVVKEIRDYTTFIKRSLMSFDRLNRLVKKSTGSGSSGKNPVVPEVEEELSFMDKLYISLGKTADRFKEFKARIQEGVEKILALRTEAKELPPALENIAGSVRNMLGDLIGFPDAVDETADSMQKMGNEVQLNLKYLAMLPESMGRSMVEMKNGISDFPLWLYYNYTVPVAKRLQEAIGDLLPASKETWRQVEQVFVNYSVSIYSTVEKLWTKLQNGLSDPGNAFEKLTSGVANSVKNAVNRVISGINEACIDPFQLLNASFTKLKNFSIGNLQPFKNFNFCVPVPKIPFLAKGAVLPANKPFLAMLGDQKSGTNVEAPLSTIQQAVAQVMEDVVEAEMAGHNATVHVLSRILEAVLGMGLNEQAIGQAAAGYALRQNMMTGGF